VEPQQAETAKRSTWRGSLWRGAFCIGAAALICCLVVIAANPVVGSSSPWIYWLAIGSAVLCAVAAVQLWSYGRYDAAEEGAWLARVGTRSSKGSWDDLDRVDD